MSMNRQQAARAKAEAKDVIDMMALPAWRWATSFLSDMGRAKRRQLLDLPVGELEDGQRAAAGCEAPFRVVEEVMYRAVIADQALATPVEAGLTGWLAEENGRETQGLAEYTPETAQQQIEQARHVSNLIAQPGWKVLMRELCAGARASAAMLEHCSSGEASHHRAAINSVRFMLIQMQQVLDLGVDSEAYLRVCAERQKKEGD